MEKFVLYRLKFHGCVESRWIPTMRRFFEQLRAFSQFIGNARGATAQLAVA
jgi:hypothetical protein